MAKKVSENYITDKSLDWGLDPSNNLPFSGQAVQKFIKDELQGRMGTLHYDEGNERYLAFADNADKEAYIADPENNATLVLATWNAPANYTAEIDVTTPPANFIHEDEKGNYIEFTFDIKNRTGASTGDSIICTYVITNGGKKQEVVATYTAGTKVQFLVDGYLSQGTNNIVIKIQGQSTYAATQASVSYVISDLVVTSDFQFQNIVSGEVNVPYHVEGSGTKYVEVYLDNVLMDESSYNDSKADATKTVPVSSPGKHNIQIRAYVVNNSTKFYTSVLYYDFAVVGGNDTLFLVSAVADELGESLSLGVEQYGELSFKWAVYSPKEQVVNVEFLMNNELLSTATSTNGVVNDFIYVANEEGSKTLTVNYANSSLDFGIEVDKSDLNVKEATEGLITKLSAKGRSNNESNPAVWENNGVTTSFNGFAWNETQGWNNGQLVISKGASIEVNIAPFDGDITSTGKSIELEFQTASIIDAGGTICECVNPLTGAGIVITPTSAVLRSAGGSEVVERFKDNEKIKVCFIINRNSTVTDKQLMFIVTDGIHSRCASYGANDTFYGTDTLKFTSDAATIKLDTIRIYNRAITVDEELNNVMIDSDNLVEMYSKNDIYEEGTNKVSVEKVSAHIPVLIFTGDIETLLRASDKNTSVRCDIEFINNQNPKYSFRVVNAKVKLQGTSSLGYPRKNFRFYTDETDICKIYDYAGELIADGKFSFKEGAQPVTCWCLKADFAESSGAHNTGIAKLWNNVMKNVKLNDDYVCRTQAQKKAFANNYEYDVRTTIDGYPIVCFYRQTATSELVFLGQYNFNNDKSTESVFGFCDIPGIDYSSAAEGNVQCWECLGNTNDLGLFKTVANFDSKWEEAFEARYPDLGGDAPTTDLKAFATWLVSTRQADDVVYSGNITIAGEVKSDSDKQYGSELGYTVNGSYADTEANRQLKFEREKWDYMDVYKMAAYYIYFMRFGAVDQLVKNSMLTTEGTQGVGTKCKWFYINYDNDTINGLVNNGRLLVAYDADRNTPSSLSAEEQDSAYEYAGHESTLWNNLEKDDEFMRIVRDLDNAMYSAGLTYKEIMAMFDNEQTDKWCERIYNSNGRYKYIQPYQESNTDYMFMLQGARKSHRHWWLSNRFEIYDSKWITGSFLSQYVEFKVDNGAATEFTITSGKKLNYGYGVNAIVLQSGIELNIDESHTFDISDDGYTKLAIGDPVRIYGAPSLKSFELRNYQSSLTDLNVSRAATGNTDCLLEGIYLGTENGTNSSLTAISGLNSIKSLKELDIRGFKALTELTLTDLTNLNKFLAANSGLTAFSPASGVNLSEVSLPNTLQVLTMNNASVESFGYVPTATLRYLSLKNVEGIDTLDFVKNWVSAINGSANAELLMRQATFEASGLDWTMTAAELIEIGKIGNKNLTGKAYLTVTPTVDEITALVNYFGTNCFDKDAAFIIDAPEGVTFVGKTSFKSGNTETYSLIEFPVEGGVGYTLSLKDVTSTIEDGKVVYITDNVKFYPATGEMVTTESATEKSVTVRAVKKDISMTTFDLNVLVESRTYPESVSITGGQIRVADQEYTYNAEYTPSEFDGTVSVEWSIESSNVTIVRSDMNSCTIKASLVSDEVQTETLIHTLTKLDGSVISTAYELFVTTSEIIMTAVSNPEVFAVCRAQGWVANDRFMTAAEASAVTDIGTSFKSSDIVHFEEFVYFTGVTVLDNAFWGCGQLTSINLPNGLTTIRNYAFYLTGLTELVLPDSITTLGDDAFRNAINIRTLTVGRNVATVGKRLFMKMTSLEVLNLGSGDYSAAYSQMFQDSPNIRVINIGDSVTKINTNSDSDGGNLKSEVLEEINVEENNTVYSSYKGALMNKEKTILYKYPSAKQTLEIPTSITKFDKSSFWCTHINNLVVPSHVTDLSSQSIFTDAKMRYFSYSGDVPKFERYTFRNCVNLEEFSFRDFTTSIGDTAYGGEVFAGCISLKKVRWSSSCNYIPLKCFQGCTALTEVSNIDHVTRISSGAFDACSSLTEFKLGESLTHLSGSYYNNAVFNNCTSLDTVVSLPVTVPESTNATTFSGTPIASGTGYIYVPDESVEDYKAATNWSTYASQIMSISGWQIITSDSNPAVLSVLYANDLCANEGYMTYGEAAAVTSIGSFFRSSEITSFNEFEYFTGITLLGYDAFKESTINSIQLPDSLLTISGYVFKQTRIEVFDTNNVTSIGVQSFAYSRITKITLNESLSSIGENAFMGCTYLENVIIRNSNSVITAGNAIFKNSNVESGTAFIYVPDALVDGYKAATNWSTYASQIKPLSEYIG